MHSVGRWRVDASGGQADVGPDQRRRHLVYRSAALVIELDRDIAEKRRRLVVPLDLVVPVPFSDSLRHDAMVSVPCH